MSEWACPICTMINVGARTMCSACGSDKPQGASQGSSTVPRPAARTSSVGGDSKWICTKCTFANDAHSARCSLCNTAKPKGKKKRATGAGNASATKRRGSNSRSGRSNNAGGSAKSDQEASISYLMNLGFNRKQALRALRLHPKKDEALDFLLNGGAANLADSLESSEPSSRGTNRRASDRKSGTGRNNNSNTSSSGSSGSSARRSVSSGTGRKSDRKQGGGTKKLNAATRKRLIEKQKAEAAIREKEREALLEVERQRVEQLRLEDLAFRKQQGAELAKQRLEEELAKKVQAEQERLEKLEEKRREEADRARKRAEQEAQIPDIKTALEMLAQDYDLTRVKATLSLLSNIIKKILQNPMQPKYRRLNAGNDKIRLLLVRPVPAYFMLKQLGFRPEQHVHDDLMRDVNENHISDETDTSQYLILEQPNERQLEHVLSLMSSYLNKEGKTQVPRIWSTVDAKIKVEIRHLVAVELRKILHNVVTLPSERNFRQVDKESFTFRKRLGKIPQALQILDLFGFKDTPSGRYLEVDQERAEIPIMAIACRELSKEISKLASLTPIYEASFRLMKENKFSTAKIIVETLASAHEKLMLAPQEQKYQRINLKKLFKKSGPMNGGYEFVQLFGWKVDEKEQVAVFPCSKNGMDLELLQYRNQELKRAWEGVQAIRQTKLAQRDAIRLQKEREARRKRLAEGGARDHKDSSSPMEI